MHREQISGTKHPTERPPNTTVLNTRIQYEYLAFATTRNLTSSPKQRETVTARAVSSELLHNDNDQ
jgi:hypothetical protein